MPLYSSSKARQERSLSRKNLTLASIVGLIPISTHRAFFAVERWAVREAFARLLDHDYDNHREVTTDEP